MTMYVSPDTMRDMRVRFLKQMCDYIQLHIADEDAYAHWIDVVPDEPKEEDFIEIAEDDELWVLACTTFGKIANEYEGH